MLLSHHINQCWLIIKGSVSEEYHDGVQELYPPDLFRDYTFKMIKYPKCQWANQNMHSSLALNNSAAVLDAIAIRLLRKSKWCTTLRDVRNVARSTLQYFLIVPDSKVHGANIGPIWGRQDPGGPPWTLFSGYFQMQADQIRTAFLIWWNTYTCKTAISMR